MKKFPLNVLLLFVAAACIFRVHAQINLNSNNFPVGGLTLMKGFCTGTTNILGNPGPNQFYDFQNIAPIFHDTVRYFMASATPWSAYHPGASVADFVVTGAFTTVNFYKADVNTFTKTGLTMIGDFGQGPDTVHGSFNPADTILSSNYTYGHSETERATGIILNFIPFGVYKTHTLREILVDGWGQLQTPVNYYSDVLRIKYREFRYDTATFFGTPIYTFADTLYFYRYYAKDIRHPVVTAYTDSSYNLIYFEYLITPPVIYGCMDSLAQNYNPLATQPDGNCLYCNVNYTITPDTILCNGGPITLSVSGGTGYLWFNGDSSSSIVVNPQQTTIYTVYVSSGVNCHALASVKVTVEKPVTASFWTTQSTYGTGEVIQFINLSMNATHYLWDFDDSLNSSSTLEFPLHTYTTPGLKTVKLTAWNTCYADSFQDTLMIVSTASAEKKLSDATFRIYPVPAEHILNLTGILQEDGILQVNSYDLLGRKILLFENIMSTGKFNIEMNVNSIPPGIEILEIIFDNEVHYVKWIKHQ